MPYAIKWSLVTKMRFFVFEPIKKIGFFSGASCLFWTLCVAGGGGYRASFRPLLLLLLLLLLLPTLTTSRLQIKGEGRGGRNFREKKVVEGG